jgi:hypothetical protein
MCRLILVFGALALVSGCGKPEAGEAKKDEAGKRELSATAKPAQVAEDFIAGSWKGSSYDIISVKEQPTTLRKAPAVAVYVQWKIKGEDETRHDLLLIQEGRVKSSTAFDVNRNLDENVTTAVHQFEAP